jgi:transposase
MSLRKSHCFTIAGPLPTEQPSVYPIKGGDSDGLMAKLRMATDRCAKLIGKEPSILICYEAGYDSFWLARFLKARAIECLVIDSASMQVNRRSRRPKTDRIDLGKLLRPRGAACVVGGSHSKHR